MSTVVLRTGPPSAVAPSSLGSSILIVDDHAPNLLALEAVLSPLSEECVRASSGAEALRLLEQRDVAVVLLDVQMPGMSGFDVAARLRSQGRQTPIIFLTAAQEDNELRAHGYDKGAVDFLVKPFEPAVLRAKVRTFVELHRQRRELERLTTLYDTERLAARRRVQTLAAVSAKLSRWLTAEAVASVAVHEAHDAIVAATSVVYLLSRAPGSAPKLAAGDSGEQRGLVGEARSPRRVSPDTDEVPNVGMPLWPDLGHEVLVLAAARGFEAGPAPRLALDAELPAAAAVKSGAPIWLQDRAALLRVFPSLAAQGQTEALCAFPLGVGSDPVGVVTFSFDEPRRWDGAEQEFLITLAAQFAAALERARLLATEHEVHRELEKQSDAMRLMADVSTLLSSSLDYQAVLRQLTELLVPAVADWCAVDVLDASGRIVRLSAFHVEPAKLALALELEQRYPVDPDATQGVPNVLRTGQTEWLGQIPDALLASSARDQEHLRIIRQLGLRSYVIVPIKARGRVLGALSLVYAESGRSYIEPDVRYIEELAARAALSVDNALLFQEQVDARERLTRQSRQALLAGDVGSALTGSDTLRDALQRCAGSLVQHLEAAFARIWTLDGRGEVLELQASAGLYTHLDGPHGRVPLGKYKIGRIAQDGAPHLTNDVQQDPWVGDPEWACREGMVSFAGYPLVIEGKVIGVMALFGRKPLAADTLGSLSSVADAIAIGIERSRAAARAREERDTLEVVNEVGRALAAELDQERLVQSVTDFASRLAGAAFGAFFYNVNDGAGSCTSYAVSGAPREAFAKVPTPRNIQGFAGDGIVRVDDIRKDPRYGHNPPHLVLPEGHSPVASYLAVPVVSRRGKVIGGLFFGHPEPGVFSERSQMLVSGVAAQVAIAMDNARLFREAQRLITQLDKSNKELDQFAYVASHDLKAPLRGIANLSQWLEEDLGEAITDGNKQQLDLLRSRVHRMEGLINGILDYSRAGRVRSKPELVPVARLLEDVIEMSAAPAGARIEVGAEMPELHTERVPLQQVFMNLVGNALKHAKRDDPQVRVRVSDAGELFEFAVSDNGPGIAPEFQERIWGIFQTLEPRDTIEGTGIGLSIVRKVVESKGGRAWVESSEGRGATFRFTWPKAEREVPNSV